MARANSQREAIKADLLAGHEVNQRTAIERHRCYRLSSIIMRIRRLDGWPVETHQAESNSFACYRLPDGWQPPSP